MLQVNDRISIPLREFTFQYSRSSGPGGQNVNKLNTRVQLRWTVCNTKHLPESVRQRFLDKYKRRITTSGEIIVTSQRFRDQGRNVADAINKLRDMILAVAKPPTPRKKKKLSRRAKQKRLDSKRRNSEKKKMRKDLRD